MDFQVSTQRLLVMSFLGAHRCGGAWPAGVATSKWKVTRRSQEVFSEHGAPEGVDLPYKIGN